MKSRLFTLFAAVVVLSMSACHYGADKAKEGLKVNEEYKAKRAEKEAATALPEDAAAIMRGDKAAPEKEDTTSATTDTSAVDTTAGE